MALRVKDIAKEMNVSPATVSMVLNNKPGIGSETRKRILKYVEEIGYGKGPLSKPALRCKNIRLVIYRKHGLVVSDTSFFSALMESIDCEARDEGYNLLISYVNEMENNSKMEVLRLLAENPPEGIFLLATEMNQKDILPFKQLNLPMLLLDSSIDEEGLDTVVIHNFQGAYLATRYLLDNGYTDIGYLHSSVWIQNFDERKEGLLAALLDAGLTCDRKHVYELEPTIEGSYRDMKQLIEQGMELPAACFADNDIIAMGAMKALKERGVRIPEDISIVGFDDMPFCEIAEPPLTTVKVYNRRMGALSVQRLIGRIENKFEETVKVQVSTGLIERQSVLVKVEGRDQASL